MLSAKTSLRKSRTRRIDQNLACCEVWGGAAEGTCQKSAACRKIKESADESPKRRCDRADHTAVFWQRGDKCTRGGARL